MELPETFLKRWLLATNKDLTEEQLENDFDYFTKDLQWQLIKNSVIKENELKVTPEETQDFARLIGTGAIQSIWNLRYSRMNKLIHLPK